MASQQGQKDNHGKVPRGEMKEGATAEECRCKEMSKKTFPQMLKSMFLDFAFWKRRPKKL